MGGGGQPPRRSGRTRKARRNERSPAARASRRSAGTGARQRRAGTASAAPGGSLVRFLPVVAQLPQREQHHRRAAPLPDSRSPPSPAPGPPAREQAANTI